MTARNEFPSSKGNAPKAFNQLVRKPKPAVSIAGDDDFSRGGLMLPKQRETMRAKERPESSRKTKAPDQKRNSDTVTMGRPKKDPLYVATLPQRISPATKAKLDVLQEYVTELRSAEGRVTFDVLVSALADAYVNQRLSTAKVEHFQDEFNLALKQIMEK